jgi:hypothetical protein
MTPIGSLPSSSGAAKQRPNAARGSFRLWVRLAPARAGRLEVADMHRAALDERSIDGGRTFGRADVGDPGRLPRRPFMGETPEPVAVMQQDEGVRRLAQTGGPAGDRGKDSVERHAPPAPGRSSRRAPKVSCRDALALAASRR